MDTTLAETTSFLGERSPAQPARARLREVWFNHLLLLGFDSIATEEKFKVSFKRCTHNAHTCPTLPADIQWDF